MANNNKKRRSGESQPYACIFGSARRQVGRVDSDTGLRLVLATHGFAADHEDER